MLLKAYQNEKTLGDVCVDLHVQILPLLPKHALNIVERNVLLMFKTTCLTPLETKNAITPLEPLLQAFCKLRQLSVTVEQHLL